MAACCDYTAGMLREPVAFTRAALASDGAGGQTETWAAIAGTPTRGSVIPQGGGERYQADRVDGVQSYRIVTRYSAALRVGDRVTVRSQALNIRALRNVEMRNMWLEIDAEAGVAS